MCAPCHSQIVSVAAMDSADSLVCIGLDPQPARTRPDDILEFNLQVIEATADLVCAYKPQSAFYEAAGNVGWQALTETIAAVRRLAPDAIVILDAKRNDIGHTAEAYASAAFDWFGVDAVTVNPYLGADAVAPFLVRPERGAFVLCRTSNPGGARSSVASNGQRRPALPHRRRQRERVGSTASPQCRIGRRSDVA